MFTIRFKVMSNRVFRFPRNVLHYGLYVVGLCVFRMLRRVLTITFRSIRVGIITRRREVDSTIRLRVLSTSAVAAPRCFINVIRHCILSVCFIRFARCLQYISGHINRLRIVKVPRYQAPSSVRVTAISFRAICVPRKVIALGTTVCDFSVTAFFSNQFANAGGRVFRAGIIKLRRKALTPRFDVFGRFRLVCYFDYRSLLVLGIVFALLHPQARTGRSVNGSFFLGSSVLDVL